MTGQQCSSIFDLDPAQLGAALLAACVAARQLGHESVAGTVRDYIAPHGPYDPECEFALGVLAGINPEKLISEDDLVAWMQQRRWTEPGVAE